MKGKSKKLAALVLAGFMALGSVSCGATANNTSGSSAGSQTAKSPLDPDNPTTITIWNYYNGDLLAAFDALISEFNSTVGVEEGIAVESISQGDIGNLADSLIDAADGKVGAQDLPTLASVYAESAYILEQKNLLVNLDEYFTAEELSEYIPDFIEEGRMGKEGDLLLFPVSKSTECFAVNSTDCAAFEAATGMMVQEIDSYERLTEVAEAYYKWTDSLTPDVAEDGKALYGRDSVGNYIYIGAAQLGHEMFQVTGENMTMDLDKETFRTLWDNYYIPYINGYFTSEASYRSEDMKTGIILTLTGATSGVSYLPKAVTDINDVSHDIEIVVEKPLYFENSEKIDVQQGAGYCVMKGTPQEQYAAAEFLKWFTQTERNLGFAVSSGYSAVTTAANDPEKIKESMASAADSEKEQNILDALLISADIYRDGQTYMNRPFEGSKSVRSILEHVMEDTAVKDRAAVADAISQGMSREEATAPYAADAYFESWFDAMCTSVKEAVQ
ncbi:MAG: extracellular solute-binding protein [Hespellia sp.]|nr:extracellular solute-binding protein [Hespellia sp.]